MNDGEQNKKEFYKKLKTKELEVYAKQGDAKAQFKLGACFYNGTGVEQDYKKAFEWFLKAAEQGDLWAQNDLGNCYLDGLGVEKESCQSQRMICHKSSILTIYCPTLLCVHCPDEMPLLHCGECRDNGDDDHRHNGF